jgi:hypothetical protein
MYHTSVLKLIKSEPLGRFALAIPALGTLIGSILLAFGGFLPCLLMDAAGLLFGLLILISLVLKYLWIEHLLIAGEEAQAVVLIVKENPGLPMAQTTVIDYQFNHEGVHYKNRATVHLPEEADLKKATILFDPDMPDHCIIKELYCVPSHA